MELARDATDNGTLEGMLLLALPLLWLLTLLLVVELGKAKSVKLRAPIVPSLSTQFPPTRVGGPALPPAL